MFSYTSGEQSSFLVAYPTNKLKIALSLTKYHQKSEAFIPIHTHTQALLKSKEHRVNGV